MEFIQKFKNEHNWTDRLTASRNLMNKYPQNIPVILDRLKSSVPLPQKHKFLIPKNMSGGEFMMVLRKHLPQAKPEQGIYLFVGSQKMLFPNYQMMSNIYTEHRDHEDDFLYLVYDYENTFG